MIVEEHFYIPGSMAIAWTCYFGYVFYVTGARVLLRMRCQIPGNMISGNNIIFLNYLNLLPTVSARKYFLKFRSINKLSGNTVACFVFEDPLVAAS